MSHLRQVIVMKAALMLFWTLLPVINTSPVPVEYPLAYNFRTLTSPKDINDLSEENMRKAYADVSSTISEVQSLLASDPRLPRLTRGEITELFETVTKEELAKSLRIGDHDRAKHMRALMLVLPYNTNNMSPGNLEELYTRPPVTKVIDSDVKRTIPSNVRQSTGRVEIVSSPIIDVAAAYQPKEKPKKAIPTFHSKAATTTTSEPIVTTAPVHQPLKWQQETQWQDKPSKYSSHYNEDLAQFGKIKSAPPMRENVKGLLASIGLTPEADKVTTVITTTTTRRPFTTTPPAKTTTINSNSKPDLSPELKELLKSFGLLDEDEYPQKFQLPIQPTIIEPQPTLPPLPPPKVELPQNVDAIQSPAVGEFKPLPESLKKDDFSMILSPQLQPDDFTAFKPLPGDAPKVLNDDMADFLRSFGLLEETQGRDKKSMKLNATEGDLKSAKSMKTPVMVEMPDVSPDLQLPANMMNVLDNIGVTRRKKVNTKVTVARTKTTPSRITTTESPKKRATTTEKVTTVASSGMFLLPENMQVARKIDVGNENETKRYDVNEEDLKNLQHLLETIQKLENLNTNLTSQQLASLNLENFNLSESLLAKGPDPLFNIELSQAKNEVKRQNEAKISDDTVTESPEPVRFALDLSSENTSEPVNVVPGIRTVDIEATSNVETKNADNNVGADEEITPTTTESSTTTTASTTTSESSRSLLLEESFGGGADPVTEEPLPTPRRNGFYFLTDINSFLEVGEDPDKIEVRFNPQVGDPSRFIPITVP